MPILGLKLKSTTNYLKYNKELILSDLLGQVFLKFVDGRIIQKNTIKLHANFEYIYYNMHMPCVCVAKLNSFMNSTPKITPDL